MVLTWSDWKTVAQVTSVDEFHSFETVVYRQRVSVNPVLGWIARVWFIWAWNCKQYCIKLSERYNVSLRISRFLIIYSLILVVKNSRNWSKPKFVYMI